jgi:hypothetical protein
MTRKAVIGDLVRCTYEGDYYGQFHGGGIYKVTGIINVGSNQSQYSFELDDRSSKINGWNAKYFELIDDSMAPPEFSLEEIFQAIKLMDQTD